MIGSGRGRSGWCALQVPGRGPLFNASLISASYVAVLFGMMAAYYGLQSTDRI